MKSRGVAFGSRNAHWCRKKGKAPPGPKVEESRTTLRSTPNINTTAINSSASDDRSNSDDDNYDDASNKCGVSLVGNALEQLAGYLP